MAVSDWTAYDEVTTDAAGLVSEWTAYAEVTTDDAAGNANIQILDRIGISDGGFAAEGVLVGEPVGITDGISYTLEPSGDTVGPTIDWWAGELDIDAWFNSTQGSYGLYGSPTIISGIARDPSGADRVHVRIYSRDTGEFFNVATQEWEPAEVYNVYVGSDLELPFSMLLDFSGDNAGRCEVDPLWIAFRCRDLLGNWNETPLRMNETTYVTAINMYVRGLQQEVEIVDAVGISDSGQWAKPADSEQIGITDEIQVSIIRGGPKLRDDVGVSDGGAGSLFREADPIGITDGISYKLAPVNTEIIQESIGITDMIQVLLQQAGDLGNKVVQVSRPYGHWAAKNVRDGHGIHTGEPYSKYKVGGPHT